jgi:hypothetical protein
LELMMPVSSRREGDSIMVDGVDLKRAARNFRKMTAEAAWRPPQDQSQALEMMARCLGYPNLHAVTIESAGRKPFVYIADESPYSQTGVDGEPPADTAENRAAGRAVIEQLRVLAASGDIGRPYQEVAGPGPVPTDWLQWVTAEFVAHLRGVADRRSIVGIVGELGCGKVTWARDVAERMDGKVLAPSAGNGRELLQKALAESVGLVFLDGVDADGLGITPAVTGRMVAHGSATFVAMALTAEHLRGRFRHAVDDRLAPLRPILRIVDFTERSSYTLDTESGERADVRTFGVPVAAGESYPESRTFVLTGAPGWNTLVMAPTRFGKSSTCTLAPDTFPDVRHPRFDQRWKNLASAAFTSSLEVVRPGTGDVLAIVGKPGTGKTLLATAMVKALGGTIIDFSKPSSGQDFDALLSNPPSIALFDEPRYTRSEATIVDCISFALKHADTKVVFIFQSAADMTDALASRVDPEGRALLRSIQVVDLDSMSCSELLVHPEPRATLRRRRP